MLSWFKLLKGRDGLLEFLDGFWIMIVMGFPVTDWHGWDGDFGWFTVERKGKIGFVLEKEGGSLLLSLPISLWYIKQNLFRVNQMTISPMVADWLFEFNSCLSCSAQEIYKTHLLWSFKRHPAMAECAHLGEAFYHKIQLWHWACSWRVRCYSELHESNKLI